MLHHKVSKQMMSGLIGAIMVVHLNSMYIKESVSCHGNFVRVHTLSATGFQSLITFHEALKLVKEVRMPRKSAGKGLMTLIGFWS